jgi:hypothetical protein
MPASLSHPLRLAALVALVALAAPPAALAQASFLAPAGSDALRLSGEQEAYLAAAVGSAGYISHQLVVLDAGALGAGRVVFDVPGVPSAEFETTRYDARPDGATWSGRGADPQTRSLLVVHGSMAMGTIHVGSRAFMLSPVAGGLHALVEFDPLEPARLTVDDAVTLDAPSSGSRFSETPERSGVDVPNHAASTTQSTVDVLFVYPPQALAAFADPLLVAQYQLAYTNQVYTNSGIPITLRLAGLHNTPTHAAPNPAPPPDSTLLDLEDLAGTTDGRFDEVHAVRDSVGADLVAMFGLDTPLYCGIAHRGLFIDHETPFSVTTIGCIQGRTFAHEVGHNMGAHHDPNAASGSGWPYGYGKVHLDTATPANSWLTIMAYGNECNANNIYCAPIEYFSTPNIVYNNEPLGDVAQRDNVRVHVERAPYVAGWRAALLPAAAAVSPGSLGATIATGTTETDNVTIANGPGRHPLYWSARLVDMTDDTGTPVPGCTEGQLLEQNAFNSYNVMRDDGFELGQSFTAPCTGTLSSIGLHVYGNNGPVTYSGTLRVYSGEGTGGTELSVIPFSVASTTLAPFYHDVVLPTPLQVEQGDVLTWYLDNATGGTQDLPVLVNSSNVYSGGQWYESGSGPGGAVAYPNKDVNFRARFGSPDTWASVTPASGVVSSGTSSDVSVLFDAAGLADGTYTGTLRLTTTDPSNPTIDVPVTLTVGAYSVELAGGAGWRMMAAPSPAMTVADLAAQNLVQGVPGYHPTAAPNLYTAFDGAAWVPAAGGAEGLGAGRGFLWYLYDEDIPSTPSSSVALPMSVAAPAGATQPAGDVPVALHAAGAGWNLVGNPYGTGLDVSGMNGWATGGALVSAVGQVWDPAAGSYLLTTTMGEVLAAWQGMFVQNGSATALTVPASARVDGGTFYRDGPEAPGPEGPEPEGGRLLAFELEGASAATGRPLIDRAIALSFHPNATAAWDPQDATKLRPLAAEYALLAFEGSRDGEAVLEAQESRPYEPEAPFAVPLAFEAVGTTGTFTLRWPTLAAVPEGWGLALEDLVTGSTTDLRAVDHLAFEAAGGTAHAAGEARGAGVAGMAPPDVTAHAATTTRFVLHVTPDVATGTGTDGLPTAFALAPPAPNPTEGSATVRYDVPRAADVTVAVYDLLGRRVAVLAEGPVAAGRHLLRLDGARLAVGTYVVRMRAGAFVQARRVTVVR